MAVPLARVCQHWLGAAWALEAGQQMVKGALLLAKKQGACIKTSPAGKEAGSMHQNKPCWQRSREHASKQALLAKKQGACIKTSPAGKEAGSMHQNKPLRTGMTTNQWPNLMHKGETSACYKDTLLTHLSASRAGTGEVPPFQQGFLPLTTWIQQINIADEQLNREGGRVGRSNHLPPSFLLPPSLM